MAITALGACPGSAASARPVTACATIAGRPVLGGQDAIPGAQTGGVRRPASTPPVRGRELLPGDRAPLSGGASHEAEGWRGARGGGSGRVGPLAGWYRLRLLREILDELVPGVEQFLLVDDVVTVEDGAALVTGARSRTALARCATSRWGVMIAASR